MPSTLTLDDPENDSEVNPIISGSDDYVGTTIGGCRLVRLVAKGGMSDVYLGINRELSRLFAVKISRASMTTERFDRSRFSREIGLHAKVTSRNVTRFHAAGRIGKQKFIIMEFVKGASLGTVIAGNIRNHRNLPIGEVVNIFRQLANGIRDIANAGIVHRDLKPDNILLGNDGIIRITDFGIATYVENDSFTDINTTLGTIGYMSPEQWNGHYLDARSDIYALGIVMLEILTNRNLAFRQENDIAFNPTFRVDDTQLRHARPDAPRALLDIIKKCLRSDRRLRFQDPQSLIDALQTVDSTSEIPASKSHWSQATSRVPEVCILLLIVTLVLAYLVSRGMAV